MRTGLPCGGALRRPRPGLHLLIALLLAVTGCGGADEPVVFGVAGPFQTPYGASMKEGAILAQQEVNAQGGIRGRLLELRFADDAVDPDSALRVADGLFNDERVVAVVGHVNSSTMVQAATIYQQGLPAVATSATSPQISRLGDWIFRVASSDSANSVALARHAQRLDLVSGVLYENEDYGRGLAEGYRNALVDAGGRVAEVDPYLPSTRDLTPYLQRMRRKGVELVFIAGLENEAARIIEQARRVGLDARFLGGDGVEGLVRMGPEYEGTMVGLLFHPEASPQATSFAERFRTAYRRDPDSFAALAYDATRLLAEAAREGGPDRRRIRDHLAAVGRRDEVPPFEGVTGTIRFDQNGDPVNKSFAIGTIRGGRIVLSEGI